MKQWIAAMISALLLAPAATTAEHPATPQAMPTSVLKLPLLGRMPSLAGATAWINSPALSSGSLRGKVVLVEFGTYSCINWIRTLPYVRAWEEKYRNKGLVVITVHTPEFTFERDLERVRTQLARQNVSSPVAVDTDFRIWEAFGNRYWPAMYFVDAKGNVRHATFGEGQYEQSERVIQQLLTEAGQDIADRRLVAVNPSGNEKQADWKALKSPELYLGYGRGERPASPERVARDRAKAYSLPHSFDLNQWALYGMWNIGREFAVTSQAGTKLTLRFQARDLHLVMGVAESAPPVAFRILIDGQPPGDARGLDVDPTGRGTVDQPRMYQLYRQPGPVRLADFEIEFLNAGAEVFAFTFG